MARYSNDIAFVIPTMDRPAELRRLLGSITDQEYRPGQIIIVNGGESSLESTLSEFSQLPIKYLEVRPPRLTKQKNAGVRVADPSISLVASLDDDIVLEPGALEAMMTFWEGAGEDVGGASFNLVGDGHGASWLTRLFSLDTRKFGRVLPSGHTTPNTNARCTQPSQWLVGGATVWRREVLRQYSFDEELLGTGVFEDLVFSYPVGKRYKLFVVAEARVRHMEPPRTWRGSFRVGQVRAINRVYFVRKNSDLSLPRCHIATLGRAVGDLAKGTLARDRALVLKACGNVVGSVQVATRRVPRGEASTYVSGTTAHQ